MIRYPAAMQTYNLVTIGALLAFGEFTAVQTIRSGIRR
jgi:hypothetical protein